MIAHTICSCGCGGLVSPGKRYIHGHHARGRVITLEFRAKMSAIASVRTYSPETLAKMRAAKLGRRLSAEHKAKIARRGDRHPNWKGGRKQSSDRYVVIWVDHKHPMFRMAGWRGNRAYIREHRLVMAMHLGRPLTDKEVVHHKLKCEGGSGNQRDNRIENLTLFASNAQHMRHHKRLNAQQAHDQAAIERGDAGAITREAAKNQEPDGTDVDQRGN